MTDQLPALEWGNFLEELQGISERASAIVSGAMLETILGQLIQSRMVDDEGVAKNLLSGPLGGFSARINTTYMLGLTGEREYRELLLIMKIRNRFAHDWIRNFSDEDVADRCRALQIPDMFPGTMSDPRARFNASVVSLVNNLGAKFLGTEHIEAHKDIDVTFHEVDDGQLDID